MNKFWNLGAVETVIFNTCGYESDLEVGKKHYKSQQFSGTLRKLQDFKRSCQCGSPSNHDIITGACKSRASATYPTLCKEYARLAVEHFMTMGKEEFLKSCMTFLQDT